MTEKSDYSEVFAMLGMQSVGGPDEDESSSTSQACYATCAKSCEAIAYQNEIRRLKTALVKGAADVTRIIHMEGITDGSDECANERRYKKILGIVQRLRAAGLDGA